MTDRTGYHHGDLRAALLQAGAEVLAETGVDKFSLRKVARKVGVSHSAPAHHFGDSDGLLMAIAAEGFRQLLAMMEAGQAARAYDSQAEAIFGSALGYVGFARRAPATLRLMFGEISCQDPTDELKIAGKAAFEHLARNIETLTGANRESHPQVMADIIAAWSMVHGFSDLAISGQLGPLDGMSGPEQDAVFRAMFVRVLPPEDGQA